MNINKALKKQINSYKRFMLIMGFIFFILPFILLFFKILDVFFVTYLAAIELLIVIAIIAKINMERLKFSYNNGKLYISSGIRREIIVIPCDKVQFIHVQEVIRKYDKEKDFIIIILLSFNIRSRAIHPINEKFLREYPFVAYKYSKLKILMPENNYSFTVISKGRLFKYKLLDLIYSKCVNASFSEETIDKIREYRNL
ncbi:hypothetical protein K144313037_01360 [Clostridium tetani]|uniref:Transmembrane protein n=2 Tax=Clostridium tetani TaxID=1513 RepID=A0A4Q0VBB6_CLOTA|nr:hypothetical protein [Clostridium tetani]AVP55553.1 hypothetical protein C3B72_10535 [Clostridium tetani]KGI37326.1 hypothetical protein LA33_10690 [Clostridium tetani ATCC 9441]KGI40732.1 hypothetical protein KY52_03015 [Clostridium tetani]KGI42188.1 hypothetical protein KY54_13230 [Clostridium tetani]KGI44506.1 hypothetical protein KY55_03900 [Clostridium tetani]